MRTFAVVLTMVAVCVAASPVLAVESAVSAEDTYFVQIEVWNKLDRTLIADLGVDIFEVQDGAVLGLATDWQVARLEKLGFAVTDLPLYQPKDFPSADSLYHNYAEVTTALQQLAAAHPNWAKLVTIGQTIEGRNIYLLRITSNPTSPTTKPAIWFMGAHHAREHLSVEVSLAIAQMLLGVIENRPGVQSTMSTREVWVSPMINPDGAEFDVASGSYAYWRKNRRANANGTYGVDLNRNYGYEWGGSGSSPLPGAETYRGTAAFSEPETAAVRDYAVAHPELTEIISYHSYSELVLYPWSYTYNGIGGEDQQVHAKMANVMAYYTGYTAQQSSALYLSAGDTCDWAWGELGVFCWTIELFPTSSYPGFYPADEKIQPTIAENYKAAAAAIAYADDPYRILGD